MTSRDALFLTTAVLLGCTPSSEPGPPIRRDSLGVSLIEYPTSFAAAGGRQWTTDSDPLYSIGGTGTELFRVLTALFQSDGGVVVADGGAAELLLFDRLGNPLARAGGEGGGPGEFHRLTSLSIGPGDSIFAYDAREHRLSVFDRRGVFVRAVTLQGLDTLGSVEEIGVLRSGVPVGSFLRRTPGSGVVRDSLAVTTFGSSGAPAVRLGVFPHMYTDWGPHPMPGGGGPVTFPLPLPLSSLASVSFGDSSVYVGLPDRYAVIRLDQSGTRRITRQRDPPPPVTDADRERLFAALARWGHLRTSELDIVRHVESPSTLPGFGFEPHTMPVGEHALLVTDADGVWLRPFQLPGDSATAPWPRFDADGLYEGTVTLPARFRATAVRGDAVLGVYRDVDDVEYVRAYHLVLRSPPNARR
jgi:hypothetical protein